MCARIILDVWREENLLPLLGLELQIIQPVGLNVLIPNHTQCLKKKGF